MAPSALPIGLRPPDRDAKAFRPLLEVGDVEAPNDGLLV
jgi:hypothetical protein